MRWTRLHAWVGAFCGALLGCSMQRGPTELELRRVAPAMLEPGVTLRIEGRGFPTGQACELWLRGRSYRPGLPNESVAVRVGARALSDDEVAAPLEASTLWMLGGRGTFDGELLLEFKAQPGVKAMRGKLRARLDVSLPLERAGAQEQALRERASRVLDFAGIVVGDEEPMLLGLVVASLRDVSPAVSLGLQRGDVIVSASGVNIHSLQDLAPRLSAQRLELRVKRPGQSAPLELELVLGGLLAPDSSAAQLRASVLLSWLLACVLLLSPLPPRMLRLARDFFRTGEARSQTRSLHGLRGLGPRLALSMAGMLLVWVGPLGQLIIPPLSFWLGCAALWAMLAFTSTQGARLVRLRTASSVGFSVLILGVLVTCACLLIGARSLGGLVESQGAWPSHWAILQKPTSSVAFPLYLVCAGRLDAAMLAFHARSRAARVLGAQRVVTSSVLCAVGVALFAGGWRFPPALAHGLAARVLGAAFFVLKVWGLAWLLARVRPLAARLQVSSLALGCLASVGLTAFWLWLEPTPAVELAIAHALAASFTLTVLVTLWRASSSSQPATSVQARPESASISSLPQPRPR